MPANLAFLVPVTGSVEWLVPMTRVASQVMGIDRRDLEVVVTCASCGCVFRTSDTLPTDRDGADTCPLCGGRVGARVYAEVFDGLPELPTFRAVYRVVRSLHGSRYPDQVWDRLPRFCTMVYHDRELTPDRVLELAEFMQHCEGEQLRAACQ